jgi:hypothetical protein
LLQTKAYRRREKHVGGHGLRRIAINTCVTLFALLILNQPTAGESTAAKTLPSKIVSSPAQSTSLSPESTAVTTSPAKSPTQPTSLTTESAGTKPPPGKKVLSPSKFFGESVVGYAAAEKCPEIIAKLFCYCGCDYSEQHTSLLDCFTCDHGADCPICRDEALMALQMKSEGKSLHEIQMAVDRKFSAERGTLPTTPALIKYRATVIGIKTEATKNSTKAKAGFKAPNCCAGHHK